jgi:hypothetical protein
MYKASKQLLVRSNIKTKFMMLSPEAKPFLLQMNRFQPAFIRIPQVYFSTKNNDDPNSNNISSEEAEVTLPKKKALKTAKTIKDKKASIAVDSGE